MALLAAVVGFCHLLSGFDNRALTALMGALLDRDYTGRHATYDLRRLRRKRLIERLPHSHRYQLTPNRRRIAVLFTKAHGRILGPGLAVLDPALPTELAKRSPLAIVWRSLDREPDRFTTDELAAA
jgi:hypothetical protein